MTIASPFNGATIVVPTPEGDLTFNIRYVVSSNVKYIGWPVVGEKIMLVAFKSGQRYIYGPDISRQRAIAIATAESPGKYLNTKIKPHYVAIQV